MNWGFILYVITNVTFFDSYLEESSSALGCPLLARGPLSSVIACLFVPQAVIYQI